jgi:hypothetical protein
MMFMRDLSMQRLAGNSHFNRDVNQHKQVALRNHGETGGSCGSEIKKLLDAFTPVCSGKGYSRQKQLFQATNDGCPFPDF